MLSSKQVHVLNGPVLQNATEFESMTIGICISTALKLHTSFHAPNRVLDSPLSYSIEVSACVFGVEFGPGKRIIGLEVESEDTNIGVALQIQAEDFDAVIYFFQSQNGFMNVKIWIISCSGE